MRALPFVAALLLAALTACDSGFIPDITPSTPISPTATPPAVDLSLTIAEGPGDLPPYDRDDWRHWTDEDGDCQDTRQEVLIAESSGPLRYRDERQCRVTQGQWLDPYTGSVVTDPGGLDVDHLVPLANAHRSGGWAWSAERKRQYANNLGDDLHLIAVTASANRQKGARGPEEWRPLDESYWCEYATAWSRVKRVWDLTVTHAEATALKEMLQTCEGPINFEASGVVPVSTALAPQPNPLPAGTYASCAEAEAAGEPRVKGGQGEGWGFPASMLPNSRDGDADGVVCEALGPASAQPTVTANPTPALLPAATPTFGPSATPEPLGVYASCGEAETAGEERVQGSIGGGVGFAAALVPGARDGDGDGVVCEVAAPAPATPTPAAAPANAAVAPTSKPTATPNASLTPTPAAAPQEAGVYASCEEAEAAGEERVQGSSGSGVGFPVELAPTVVDGDKDGVVCEVRPSSSSNPSPNAQETATVAPAPGTYASCDEAEAAGEQRVQGSSGPGRGFPVELAPSVRDGDKDGVVCEE